jgi:hypothetical protein
MNGCKSVLEPKSNILSVKINKELVGVMFLGLG